jgi:hypothetical protein
MSLRMLPSLLLFLTQVTTTIAWQNESSIAECPAPALPPFRVEDPQVTGSVKGVVLEYAIEVPDATWVTFQVADFSCTNVIPTQLPIYDQQQLFNETYQNLTAPILAKLTTTIADDNNGKTLLDLEINPDRIHDYSTPSIYTEMERTGEPPEIESRGDIQLCVKLSLWNGPPYSETAVEVTYLETAVTFGVRFWVDTEQLFEWNEEWTCGSGCRRHRQLLQQQQQQRHQQQQIVQDRRQRNLCQTTWGVQVFTCLPSIGADSYPETIETDESPILQGTIFRLCIQPNQQAYEAGVLLRDISSLEFFGGNVAGAFQTGIKDGDENLDRLTVKDCQEGWGLCVVETVLYHSFFGNDPDATQPVSAKGIVTFLQNRATRFQKLQVEFELEFEVKSVVIQEEDTTAQSSAHSISPTPRLWSMASICIILPFLWNGATSRASIWKGRRHTSRHIR